MRDIKMSIAYGWKVLSETWWWITLAGLYLPIGGALYSLAGFTAARWANNPDILARLNYETFILTTKTPPGIKWFASYIITTSVIFAIIYFFAGFVPSKRAANKNHNHIMAETAAIFFLLNIAFALLSYLAIASSSMQPNPFSFNTLFSQYLSGIATNVFGFMLFALIAVISYIYEKFTLKNVLQVTVIYFILESLQLVIDNLFITRFYRAINATPPIYNILISFTVAFVIVVFTIFIMAETVLKDSLSEGTKKGLHLLHVRGNLVWTYLAVAIVVYISTNAIYYFAFVGYKVLHITMPSFLPYTISTVPIILFALGYAFLIVATFQLARLFENRGSEETESPDENAADFTARNNAADSSL